MPCCCWESFEYWKGMNILVIIAPKGLWKEWKFLNFNPERVMIWYGVWHLSLGKSTSPTNKFLWMDLLCKPGRVYVELFLVLCWIALGQLLFSLCFHEDLKLKKEVLWRSFEEFIMNCKFYVNYIVNDWQWHRVFLLVLSRWSLEPGCIIEEKRRDYKSFLQCLLVISNFGLCLLGNSC